MCGLNLKRRRAGLRSWIWVVWISVITAWPTAASAQSDEMDRARAAYAMGQQFYDVGDFDAALLAFRESLTWFPHFKTLFNIGLCEEKLGHLEEAIDMYTRYVDWPTEVPHRDEVMAKITELEALRPPPKVVATDVGSQVSPPPSVKDEVAERPVDTRPPRLRLAGIGAGIVGGTGVLSGAALLIAAAANAHRIEEINSSPSAYSPSKHRDLAAQGQALETAAWIVGGVGLGIVVAGSVMLGLARRGNNDAAAVSVGVAPTASGAAAVASWRF